MSIFAETKTSSNAPASDDDAATTSQPSSPFFYYGDTFTRPTSVPSDLFDASVQAMKDGIVRNPYPQWDKSNGENPHTCQCEVVRHDLTKCADCRQNVSPDQVAEETMWKEKIQKEDAEVDDIIANTHECGVTLDWLLAFTFDHDCWERPTGWVNRHIVNEATRGCRSRYVHLPSMRRHARPAKVFMSHCWGSKWGDVVLAACHGARSDRVVWIDLFAVRQWPGRDADMNFREVAGKCTAMIVSFSPVEGLKKFMPQGLNGDFAKFFDTEEGQLARRRIPTCRLWCNVEIAAAVNRGVPVVVKCGKFQLLTERDQELKRLSDRLNEILVLKNETQDATIRALLEMEAQRAACAYQECESRGSESIIKRASSFSTFKYDVKCVGKLMSNLLFMIDVEGSESTSQTDYDREMTTIQTMDGGVDCVNNIVRRVVNGAASDVNVLVPEISAYICGEKEAFRALKMDVGCTGHHRNVARRTLIAACTSGCVDVVRELLEKWHVEKRSDGNDDGDDGGERKRAAEPPEITDDLRVMIAEGVLTEAQAYSMLGWNGDHRAFQQKTSWLQELIDETIVLWSSATGGAVQIVHLLLSVEGVNVNAAKEDATALYQACRGSHLNVVRRLLEAPGIAVNHSKRDGETPLFEVCSRGRTEIVRCLLARKEIEVNRPRSDGFTPLSFASDKGHTETVRLLLGHEKIDINRDVPLNRACQHGYTDIVKLLLARKKIKVNQPDKVACSALYRACQGADPGRPPELNGRGHPEIVKLLLARQEIDVNQPDKDGCCPLLMACHNGDTENVKLLLARQEIDVNEPDNNGRSPLSIACHQGFTEIVALLLARKEIDVNQSQTQWLCPLSAACGNDHHEVVRLLLEKREIDVNQRTTKEGASPLCMACVKGHIKVVQILLQRDGIDVNLAATQNGSSPLYMACHERRTEVVQLLLEREDVDVNQLLPQDGITALYYACQQGYVEVVRCLLRCKNVDVNKPRKQVGYTPLFVATKNHHFEIVELLLATRKQEIDVNQQDRSGVFSLLMACHYGHTEIVALLLARKEIDVNEPDNNGRSPLSIACHLGFTEIVKLLLATDETDVNQPNTRGAGSTPFYNACANGHVDVVQLLLATKRVDINKSLNDGQSPLFAAAESGHVNLIAPLLAAGADVHACVIDASSVDPSCSGLTPVGIASKNGHPEIVRMLNATKNASERVRLIKLKSASMNGKCGTRLKWFPEKQRYQVRLDDGSRVVLIKAENLEDAAVSPDRLQEDKKDEKEEEKEGESDADGSDDDEDLRLAMALSMSMEK